MGKISVDSASIKYLRACYTIHTCKMVICRGSSQLIIVDDEKQALSQWGRNGKKKTQ